ncbi:hypothetical protein GW17_00049224 [Ensete ventricosum]|nr:hypothetical protein GW17_00049224 [Ensete ventricosum]
MRCGVSFGGVSADRPYVARRSLLVVIVPMTHLTVLSFPAVAVGRQRRGDQDSLYSSPCSGIDKRVF